MKKLLYILPLALFLLTGRGNAQSIGPSEAAELLQVTPKEKMFVHYNASILFPGEYLYYQTYLLQAGTHTPSDVSKVVYLELVAENGEQVFHHLLLLENGQGHGDFFIPTDLPSGPYKLLGYTNWMRNTGNSFEADLLVINPYRRDLAAFTPKIKAQDSVGPFVIPEHIQAAEVRNSKNQAYSLNLNKQLFGSREKVLVNIAPQGSSELPASVSVSVRILDSIRTPDKPKPVDIVNEAVGPHPPGEIILPEIRGTLISGKIEPITPEPVPSLANVKVVFSVPGDPMLYKIATTDENGSFYLSFDEPRTHQELLIQILGKDRNSFRLVLEETPDTNYSRLDFADYLITSEMQQWILDRSIQNQIENAYYNQKPDTIDVPSPRLPFYSKMANQFELDDYTRFPTIAETFVEIIGATWIGKDEKGGEVIVIREVDGSRDFNLPPLLLVDGVMVQDHSSFISYPAKDVKSIGILRNNFFIGSHIFEGIIDVRTFDGNFWKEHPQKYLLHKELPIPRPSKRYFQQTYIDSTRHTTDHLPDLRTQLLWRPQTQLLPPQDTTLEFFTSDLPGTYQVEIEGFTADGTPVSLRAYLEVKEPEKKEKQRK